MNFVRRLLAAVDRMPEGPSPYDESEWGTDLEREDIDPAPEVAPAPALMVGVSLERVTIATQSMFDSAQHTHNCLVDELGRVQAEADAECRRLKGEIEKTLVVIAGQNAALEVFQGGKEPKLNLAYSPKEFAEKLKANGVSTNIAETLSTMPAKMRGEASKAILDRPDPYAPVTHHERLFPNAPRRDIQGRLPSDDGADPSPL